jgi:hypothetical protein
MFLFTAYTYVCAFVGGYVTTKWVIDKVAGFMRRRRSDLVFGGNSIHYTKLEVPSDGSTMGDW